MQTETQQAQQALHDKLMRAVTMTSDYTLFMSTLALIVATWLLQVPHDLNRNEVTQLLFAALVPPLPDPGTVVAAGTHLRAGHPLYMAIISLTWLWWLFGHTLLASRRERFPHMYRATEIFRRVLGWPSIFLHELSHAVFAILTAHSITRFDVHWDWGYVGTWGSQRMRSLYSLAPLIWTWLGLQTAYLLATHTLLWWQGVGLALAVPVLIRAGKPSGGDFVNAGLIGKLAYLYVDLTLLLLVFGAIWSGGL